MKIVLYMATPGGLTGAPRRLITLGTCLARRGYSVCVVSEPGSELLAEAKNKGLATAEIELCGNLGRRNRELLDTRWLNWVSTGIAIIRQNVRFFLFMKRYNPDVVCIRISKGMAFAGAGTCLARRPILWDVDYELPSRGAIRILHSLALWFARGVTVQYESASEKIFGERLSCRYREKIHPVIPAIDLDALRPYVGKARSCRSRNSKDGVRLVQIGTVCDRKNQLATVEALGQLEMEMRGRIELWLIGGIGDEGYAERVRCRARELGLERVIRFLGWRGDVYELMAQADMLLMPSKDEGVPNAVQEAMYLGVPTIVSGAGGTGEIISHGRTGWIIPPDKPKEWAECITKFEWDEGLRLRVSRAASKYASESFGMHEWGKQYSRILACLCKSP